MSNGLQTAQQPVIADNPPIVTITAAEGQRTFNWGFLIQSKDQLVMTLTPVVSNPGGPPITLALDQDYTIPVTALNTNDGGAATLTDASFPTGATAGDLYTLAREIPVVRNTNFPFRGTYDAATINFQLNTLFLSLQERERDQARAMTLPLTDPLESIEVPLNRANKYHAYDGQGRSLATQGGPEVLPTSDYIKDFLTQPDDEAARAYLVALKNVLTTEGDFLVQGASGPERRGVGAADEVIVSNGTNWQSGSAPLPRGRIDGFRISIAADTDHDRTIAPGKCRNEADSGNVSLGQSLTKQIDAPWAQGNDVGGLFNGDVTPVAANTSYHYCIITRNSDGAVDWGWDTDPAGANAPSGWTFQRRVGSIKSDAAANLPQITQYPNGFFSVNAPVVTIFSSPPLAPTLALAAIDDVPVGVDLRIAGIVKADRLNGSNVGGGIFDYSRVSIPDAETLQAFIDTANTGVKEVSSRFEAWCNTSAQVQVTQRNGNVSSCTLGWFDPRGQDA